MPEQPLPPPPMHPDEPPFVCIQINSTWIPYIIGMMWKARFPEYWAGTLEENRNARRDVTNLIYLLQGMEECGTVNNCCLELYVIQRVNIINGSTEVSTDNGATWQPKPGSLVTKIIEPVPAVVSGVAADKCEAANNCNQKCMEYIENVGSNFDQATIIFDFGLFVAGNIIALALIFLAQPELIPAETALLTEIGAAVTGVFEAGHAEWNTYWSIETRQKVFCAIECTIGSDGAFTQPQFERCYTKFKNDLPPGVAKQLFMAMVGQVNRQGFNSMAAQKGTSVLDCGDCNCAEEWCYHGSFLHQSWDTLFAQYDLASNPHAYDSQWVDGQGWISTIGAPNYSMIQFPLSSVPGLTQACFTSTGSDTFFIGVNINRTDDSLSVGALDCVNDSQFTGYNYISYGKRSAGVITDFEFRGTGNIPAIFGASNCE